MSTLYINTSKVIILNRGLLPLRLAFHRRMSSIEDHIPMKAVFHQNIEALKVGISVHSCREEWTFLARFGRDESLDNSTIKVTDIPGNSQVNLVINPRIKETLQKYTYHAVPGVLTHPFQCQ